ncbi:MAG: hypothetical protein CO128_07570 [Ignavibacteriales bacterium CG_4_9_14_3_um_filter_30_11]|nr:MAG: hypothetical protein CO128_07570 [Ignavibacteriales bacterium CG_4_9_14_3_um_filter_30_11]
MIKKSIIISIIVFSFVGCGVLKELTNLSRLQFKLVNLESITISSVTISNKNSIRDFSSLEVLKLSTSFIRNDMPLEFILNVEVKNPNANNNNLSKSNFKLSSFPWRLFIDGKEAIQGNISSPVNIPSDRNLSYVKVVAKVDLVNFIKEKGYEGIINLALSLASQKDSPTKIELFAKPVVETSIGKINYPEEIKIVSMNYTN